MQQMTQITDRCLSDPSIMESVWNITEDAELCADLRHKASSIDDSKYVSASSSSSDLPAAHLKLWSLSTPRPSTVVFIPPASLPLMAL